MNKVSDVLAERFSRDPLETYLCKQHPPGAWIDKIPLYDFGYAKTFRNQNVFKPIATDKVRDENINFESNRTSSLSEKTQTKQSLLFSIVSSSHQIPTAMFIIFWDFLMVKQNFLSPQVKRSAIISNKYGMYKLPHELPNDLRLRRS